MRMAQITLRGNAINTVGELPAVGSSAPSFSLTGADLGPVSSDAPLNTSCGPTTSSACTPGKPTITTLRAMDSVLAKQRYVVYAMLPTN